MSVVEDSGTLELSLVVLSTFQVGTFCPFAAEYSENPTISLMPT